MIYVIIKLIFFSSTCGCTVFAQYEFLHINLSTVLHSIIMFPVSVKTFSFILLIKNVAYSKENL
jgi:hypothetical protein